MAIGGLFFMVLRSGTPEEADASSEATRQRLSHSCKRRSARYWCAIVWWGATHRRAGVTAWGGLGKLGDVVEDDDRGEEDDADERDLVDALFETRVEVAADDGFDGEEEDHAAVEDGDGEQVEDAEVERDHGHGADDGEPAGLWKA